MKTKKMLGYYDYTVVLTYVGMLCAFTSILMAINCNFLDSVMLLMLAGLCDMFDGTVASTKERSFSEKRFGIQIDSLSDLISFGIMPAIFVYMISEKNFAIGIVSSLYALSALIRLAYFNVLEEERQNHTSEKRSVFQGVPVTTIAILLPVIYILNVENRFKSFIPYAVLLCFCGIGFLSPIEVKKPNLVGKICLIIVGLAEAFGIFFVGLKLA